MPAMTRRTLLGLFSALLTPRLPGSAPQETRPAGMHPEIDPWFPASTLDDWLRLPMRPILDPEILPTAYQKLARQLLERMTDGQPVDFTYHGGSDPGTLRRVLPVLLFQKLDPELPEIDALGEPTYLLAYCQTRNAPRTFRLDHITL